MVLSLSLALALAAPALLVRAALARARGAAWRRPALAGLLALVGLAALALLRFEARKLVGMLLMPLGLLWLALGTLAVGLGWAGLRRWALAAGGLWALVTVAGNTWVGSTLLRVLEARVPLASGPAPFDAVFILGGGTTLGPTGPELTGSGDRLRVAARLFHEGRTPRLVVSGHSVPGIEAPRDLAGESTALLADFGVPRDAVIQLRGDGQVNTLGELRAYQEEIRRRGWQRVGLVSSAWHLPRAMRICRRLGLEMVPLPADWHGGRPEISAALLVPQLGGLQSVQTGLWELLGALADG